jgi:protein-S-isoprenylcysteine O-methyltransferase Ste14
MLEILIFLVGTGYLAYVSRQSLRQPRSHGFFRFFAWITMLAIFLLVWKGWFADPFSIAQILSWILLIVALVFVVSGVQTLRKMGRPDPARDDSPMMAFEKTTKIVAVGIYRYIRHPLYGSLLFLGWGMFLKGIGIWTLLLVLAATGFLVLTAIAEEEEDIRFFGESYNEYRTSTRMFIPFLF